MNIIPAIDLIDGKCVRLTKGDYARQIVYHEDPSAVAQQFEQAGIKRLHMVDLDGARSGKLVNLKVLERVSGVTNMEIDFGGGVKTISDVSDIINAGAAIVTIGSLAAKHPGLLEEWLMEFGAGRFLVGADVLDGRIRISGWLEDGGIGIFDFIGRMISLGVTNVFCTDIAKDGVMKGPSIELYKDIMTQHPEVQLVASGGVSNMDDLVALQQIGCSGAIVGKAIYERKLPLNPFKAEGDSYSYFNAAS